MVRSSPPNPIFRASAVMSDLYGSSPRLERWRMLRILLFFVLGFTVLLVRLVDLQVFQYSVLQDKAADNYTKEVQLAAERGVVYDRNGRVLAMNRATFDLYLTPGRVRNSDALMVGLTQLLDLDELQQINISDRVNEPEPGRRFERSLISRDLSRDQVRDAEQLGSNYGGLTIRVSAQRFYPEGEVGAHVVGYLGRPNQKELREQKILNHQMIGRFGVERLYDAQLRGEPGFERYVVDVNGKRQREGWATAVNQQVSTLRPPTRGRDLVLNIDAQVQQIAYRALEGYPSGSVVVMDPRTGAVLGMVSKPSFDPNIWSGRLTRKLKQAVDENPYKPMLDKSVKSFFPGSLYKVVTAIAAMEENILDPEMLIDSPGAYEYGNRIFHCHKRSGHGRLDLSGAMAASADVYFYKLGERLGIDTLAIYGRQFGFGDRTLGLNGESAGVVPTRAYHEEHNRGGFQHGLSLSSAIGQGAVRTSPLQMAVAFSALANHGIVYEPQLLMRSQDIEGETLEEWGPKIKKRIPSDPQHIQMVRRSLERAVNDPRRATGYRAAVPMGRVAGKTGTAQVKSLDHGPRRQSTQRWQDRDHAWFAAFAPYESPRISVVVFLEHGGSGGKDSAPIARKIIEAYHNEVEAIFDSQAKLDRLSSSTRTQ